MNRAYYEEASTNLADWTTPAGVLTYALGNGHQTASVFWENSVAKWERELDVLQKTESAKQIASQQVQFSEIRSKYILEDAFEVKVFLQEHRTVSQILLDAVPSLRESFGQVVPLILRVLPEENEPSSLCALAVWKGTLHDARSALRRFDDEWWLDNCGRTSSTLIFDFELR